MPAPERKGLVNDPGSIGKRIASARNAKGLAAADLGGKPGISDGSQMSRWENDKTMPSAVALMTLSRELDISVDWILFGGPYPDAPERPASLEPIGEAERLQLLRLVSAVTQALTTLSGAIAMGEQGDGSMSAGQRLVPNSDPDATSQGRTAVAGQQQVRQTGQEETSGPPTMPSGRSRERKPRTNTPKDRM